jgi:two-component system, NtrC family, sensor kinase
MNLIDHALEPELILIVDDTPANLQVLSAALSHEGYEVGIATNGERAIRQAQYRPPALILLDVQMPGIDGFETCRRLKADPVTQGIPVIFMTALSDADHKVQGFSVGAVDYITKPFQHEEVMARVRVHLQIRHLTAQLETQNQALAQLNDNLEAKVQERTIALQQAQLSLIQQEKLSALGQLVAGIAHEINNPVNFIHGNLFYAQRYSLNLLDVLQDYQQQFPDIPQSLQAKLDAIDLPFLQTDLIKIIDSMQVGTERIQEIVLSLRSFSRLDEAMFKTVNVHDGIDSTLMILQHRLQSQSDRPAIAVVKNYGHFPALDCFPGQLNQVFMNLLANAIDAFDDVTPLHPPAQIEIQTKQVDGDRLAITIRDNGKGIPAAVQAAMFDPFFTTKSVGKGTGLGLSISHQIIVERHGGQITCRSTPHQGSAFTIVLPLRQQVNETTGERLMKKNQTAIAV